MRRWALAVVLLLAGCAGDTAEPAAVPTPTTATTALPVATRSPATTATRVVTATGLPTIAEAQLPAEARRVLELIEDGGPFPYDQDGAVFENRERLLPPHPRGWYHEYTVPTPGEDDRGARRIVTGSADERYYTADHYDSFREIVP